jgi:hypothetical protein
MLVAFNDALSVTYKLRQENMYTERVETSGRQWHGRIRGKEECTGKINFEAGTGIELPIA